MPALEMTTALAVPDSIFVVAHVIVDVSAIAGPVTTRAAGKEAISVYAVHANENVNKIPAKMATNHRALRCAADIS
jgi:hypothetical protein